MRMIVDDRSTRIFVLISVRIDAADASTAAVVAAADAIVAVKMINLESLVDERTSENHC